MVRGRLIKKGSTEAVPFAHVMIADAQGKSVHDNPKGTTTNINGEFQLNDVYDNEFLFLSHLNFEKTLVPVSRLKKGDTIINNIEIEEKAFNLIPEFEVIAKKKDPMGAIGLLLLGSLAWWKREEIQKLIKRIM